MAHWRITSEAGLDMGVFEGETKEDAIRAMNVDAWCDPDDIDANDGLTVEEILADSCECERCGVVGVQTERPGEIPEGADCTDELLCADEDGHLVCDECAAGGQ